ncbi:5'-tyrosyl-DNA phosphodiesterase [Madurella mycetomatis]|uniref:5'-tyrosyl-DNA phosphodiesterase n=1 Tax=Madurella mycetomatis TaxID=100816 RepID=A0A175WBC6_9PEZI|nr:5'-tyrosyl-DNA phosphodiesterase [Madurella mycetomatis]
MLSLQGAQQRWRRGEPAPQAYFTFANDVWHPIETPELAYPPATEVPLSFSVLSWNIDFMRPLADARMKAALKHLDSLVAGRASQSVIMLNEMVDSDLKLIGSTDWVRRDYNMTDVSTENWELQCYGTCMLVPKSMPIRRVFRVHYERTSMQRDALFVDVALPQEKTLRLCATHLESLKADPPKRPSQLYTAAKYLHQAHAGILAGDLNAIEPFDRTLHVENNLKDAYLQTGGQEDAESGMTWGQMAEASERERFGLSRMDKVLFCGGLAVSDFGTFGMGVQVESEADREELVRTRQLEEGWATDHLGVKGDFRIELLGMAAEGSKTTEGRERELAHKLS